MRWLRDVVLALLGGVALLALVPAAIGLAVLAVDGRWPGALACLLVFVGCLGFLMLLVRVYEGSEEAREDARKEEEERRLWADAWNERGYWHE